ncbi:Fanconi anemia group I protein homolog [Copidosoma floridanum]|uniref:Fanconi anemia group I protein homolog n=1 Tax=Copidosoma floridanum TaxID=29053 RepID=UPI0006C98D47|nr:Fanconi anemia group I protein homolog [Copidosoma floridanum]XP_014217238.1 Fanconi anemia group I protein homolog [Copidosoma floridanum]
MSELYEKYKSQLSGKCTTSQLKSFVQEADTNELCQMVISVLHTNEAPKMLDKLMLGFAEQSGRRSNDKRFKIVSRVFEALGKARVTIKQAETIVNRIVVDFPVYERMHLVKLVDYFVARIRNNDDDFMSWKDVIPLLLERLEEEKSMDHRGTNVTGKEYKAIIIRIIYELDWDIKILTPLAKMFVEISTDIRDKVDKKISEAIMKAFTSKLMLVEPDELPHLANQLLKLASENNSTLLFASLGKYFSQNYNSVADETNDQEDSESIISGKVPLKELQECESNVLYYIYDSAVDNTKGSTEYMQCLKSIVNAPEYILESFVMSVLLLLSNLYEDQALQILKAAFARQVQEKENQGNCAWLRQISSNDKKIMDTIDHVIENSNRDRPLILKGMVDFAFVLLSIERKAGAEEHPPWEYGCKILQKIAKRRGDAGGTILQTLVDKIVCAGTNVVQYTDCLGYMCRNLTMTVIEHRVWINSLMEQLLVIPGLAAAQVLRAILPLMRISGTIRDSLIMILRKALYRKGTETRRMAVLGFLQLLKNLKLQSLTLLSQSQSLSSSNIASSASIFTQASCEGSRRASSNPWHNTTLCREILSILSKCFTHEIEVRSHLYRELYFGIVKNEELTEYVIEMLLEHFSKYYEKDEEILPPVVFEKCCNSQNIEVVLEETAADLVFALQKIYLKVALKESVHVDKLAHLLESLCKRMARTDVEHLGIDDDVDLLDGMPKSQLKLLNVKQALSMYEALLAFRIGSWSSESDSEVGYNVLGLFKAYSRLLEFARKIGKSKKGKGKKDKDKNDTTMAGLVKKRGPVGFKPLNTVMDLETITKSIVLLLNPAGAHATEEQSNVIRGRYEFYEYIYHTCLQLLQSIKVMNDHELTGYLEINKKNLFTIGQTLFKFLLPNFEETTALNVSAMELGFECFKECCDIMCTVYSKKLPLFLESLCGVKESQGLTLQLKSIITSLKDVFLKTLEMEETEELKFVKMSVLLIEIISKFVKKITFSDLKDDELFDWLLEIAKTKENLDMQIASIVLQLILLIQERSVEESEVLHDFCSEFVCVLGRNDKTEVTATRTYNMINEDSVIVAYIATNKLLASKLQNLTFLLGRLNAEYTASISFAINSESDQTRLKEKERNLCRQFTMVLNAFEILVNAKLDPGPATDAVFKNLKSVYNLASSLAKYFRKKSTANNPAFQSVKFASVVQGASSALKEATSNLITYVESVQKCGKSSDAQVQRNKILKEMAFVPGVMQAMDMFDKEIVLLSKKTNVDLTKFTKFNAVRDFRIASSQLMRNLEEMNVSLVITQTAHNRENSGGEEQEEDEEEEEVEEEDSGESRPKKRRI